MKQLVLALSLPINKAAIAAGGNTLLEVRWTTPGGNNFTGDQEGALWEPYIYITTWVPETRIATICDEKDNYRYGFNGMEKDNEPKGLGNSLDFGARIYDSRLGRFLSLDPLAVKFPYQSPYIFAGNSPILNIDKKGLFKYPKGLEAAYAKEFPMITKYLAENIKNDVNKSSLPREIISYADNPDFGKAELSSILTWGDKSRTTIVFDKGLSGNANTVNSKQINVNWNYAKKVEGILGDKNASAADKKMAITSFYITMMDETTLAGHKYRKDPTVTEAGDDGDVGNELKRSIFYSKDGYPGVNEVYQADENDLSGTKEVIKTLENEGKEEFIPTTPKE